MIPDLPHIALIGPSCVGKSTLAAHLTDYGYRRFAWADAIRHVAALAYGPIVKDRFYEVVTRNGVAVRSGKEILNLLGTEAVRDNVDEDFWVRAGLRLVDQTDAPLVNDDTRMRNEADALARRGFVLVRINVEEAVRRTRMDNLYGPEFYEAIKDHRSDQEAMEIPYHLSVWNTADPHLIAKTLMDTLATALSTGATFGTTT